jgi:TrmH family RNA methyltransferase
MSRLTRSEVLEVASLRDKRNRDRLGLYVVEGEKLVLEALSLGLAAESVYAKEGCIHRLHETAERAPRIVSVSPAELRRLSAQKTPNQALVVLRKPDSHYDWAVAASDPVLVLESVQDPGNVGSLLRVAVWFGISDVVLSADCADPFGPKAVQGSMGAIFRVRVHVLPLLPLVEEARRRELPIVATALAGERLSEARLEPRGLLLFGNESMGLSGTLLDRATQRVVIPPWNDTGPGRDSLNVAAAAAVFCFEIRRRAASSNRSGHAPR